MQPYRILGASLGWFAILAQYWLNISESGFLAGSAVYFGFFTLLGNIQVTFAFTAPLLPETGVTRFFRRPGVRTAIAVYIVVVGVIYYLLLRQLYAPAGLGYVLNLLLHGVMPVLYVLDWIFFCAKRSLAFRQIPHWLIFPLLYAAATLLRGAWSGYYPYPFLDAGRYGYPRIAINIAWLGAFFILLSAAFVGIGRIAAGRRALVQR